MKKEEKYMKRLIWLLPLTMFLLFSGFALAEEKSPQAEVSPKPRFTPELRELSFLVGSFMVDITLPESPLSKAGFGKGTLISQWGLDSTFLLLNVDEIGPAGRYRGHGYLTYDKMEKRYKLWWFNNWGEASDYQGDFVRDTLILEGEIQTPEKIMKMKLMWHQQGEKLIWRVMADLGEGYKLVSERMGKPLRIGKIETETKKQK